MIFALKMHQEVCLNLCFVNLKIYIDFISLKMISISYCRATLVYLPGLEQ